MNRRPTGVEEMIPMRRTRSKRGVIFDLGFSAIEEDPS
jgi:hypothetical protein